ncbi:DUF6777 domain-containing protein [Streptomyces sp. NBC_01236]|uniref:DUF6777 domain-containing protein n=1 Tax=Streptomyces sp. NBC_01236 TaxID=2903789 RepID=UPI002E12C0B4|nr:hypothetical protein OG324_45775 [Streptomyces sp. NBC_01236]
MARQERENAVHIPTRTLVTACALSATLVVAGCGGDNQKDKVASGGSGSEVFLQPVAAQGPHPFTDSSATPPPVTRMPQPASTGAASGGQGERSLSGSTPGLYSGTQNTGSCDVEKQIGFLAADRSKARAFAQASGISQASVPDFLRGLTSVVLRADSRVTNHGFSKGQATSYQSVLQAGTAVLVDNRGVPRVRCACGNPLNPPSALEGNPGTQGRAWDGYRPAQVVVVTPAPTVITKITIINIVDNTWIERRIGDDGHHDHVVPPADDWTQTQTQHPRPDHSAGTAPHDESPRPHASESDCVTPTETVTDMPGLTESAPGETPDSDSALSDTAKLESPADESLDPTDLADEPTDPADRAAAPPACPTATVTAPPTTEPGSTPPPSDRTPPSESPSDRSTAPETGTTSPDRSASDEPSSPAPSSEPDTSSTSGEDIGPDTVPDSPDVPDGGGLIPDDPPTSDSIFDAPTDVFDS